MMKNAVSIRKTTQIALATIYLVPLILLIWFVTEYGVNVPFWDQWALVEFFAKIQAGQVTFQDFFAQHNEHRILFPRIIIAILAFASSWNNKLEMYCNIAIAAGIFGLVYAMARQTKSDSLLFHLSNILCCAFIFSLDQQENWLWGFQIAWFLINLCVVIAISCIVLPQKYAPNSRLLLAGLFCFIASFSSAHGLFSWLALLPLVIVLPGTVRQRSLRAGIWLALFVAAVLIYQIGYVKPGNHPDVLFFIKQPQVAIPYFLTLFGFFVKSSFFIKSCVGAGLLLNFLFFNVYFLKKFRSTIAQDLAPWITLGWFPILFSMITTIGRAGFGIGQATSSRYATVVVLLVIALIQLWRIVLSQNDRQRSKVLTSVFFSGVLIALLVSSTEHTIKDTSSSNRAAAQTCLEMIHFLEPSQTVDTPGTDNTASCLSMLHPSPASATRLAAVLEKLHFHHFAQPIEVSFVSNSAIPYGYIDAPKSSVLIQPKQTMLSTSGWATSRNPHLMPELVLFSYDAKQSFFGFGLTSLKRRDVAKALGSAQFLRSGWQTELHLDDLPVGEHRIKAWIYDRSKSSFFQLGNEFVVIRKS